MKNDAPLNAQGERLQMGSLAVDPSVIPLRSRVQIPDLVPPWDKQVFVADDTGGAIKGKHVDVYCGAGAKARKNAERITASNRRVCLS
jgi:3D (Asp-Asp-Asp) domain-containing protein